ncbi:MAG: transcription antitermination protein NusB [Bacilli bacterium]|jgi:N utilization substance protein B|nr:transcription antitermination protein NusB [Bacilli bacterium]MCH4210487.1 transcription antitermination protein NusB [Bacilli bacterium]MCH4228289.1 transcription antitermination protein NusB [Bacilli bacterium]MCH4277362.1 transcription antitermination protein NusB [Bacilli bacterium]MCI2054710.1 transcription antitermination protein NusB [Bacilli bacterium]
MKKELTRNQLQEKSLFAIYAILTYADMNEEVDVKSLVSGLTEENYEDSDPYIKAIIINVIKHMGEIIPVYNKNMRKWTFDRLNRVEQAILLLSYCQYFYVDKDVDKGVVIDVAVKLAKTYLDATDYKFVNAILDKVLTRESA